MTEEQLKEEAGLYALGMLDKAERIQFERRLGDLPDLRACVSDMEDAVSGVALTAPAKEVDPAVLEGIMAEIGVRGESRSRHWINKLVSVPGGWPAAAALMILLGIGAVRYERIRNDLVRAEGDRDAVVREMRNIVDVLDGDGEVDEDGNPAVSNGPGESVGSASSNLVQAAQGKSYRLLQNLDRVNQELAHVRKREADRATPHSGIARTLVVSMWDPDVPPEERENAQMLSEQISDIIGDELEAARSPDQDSAESEDRGEEEAKGHPSSMSFDSYPEVQVTGDALAPLWFTRDLPLGPRIRHKDFPVDSWEDLGLTRYENGTFYDQDSDMLYSPSVNGRDYMGNRPPEGFDPNSGVVPAPPEIVADPEPVAPPVEETLPVPKAFTLYDETTGEGSIILQNLPPRSDELSYHLWLNDAQGEAPIEVGVLPDFDAGDGRVYFDLQPGLSPSGYILTAEPKGESPKGPGEEVILFGP